MRPRRLLAPCDPEHGFAVLYHVTSRVVDKRFIFEEHERVRFLRLVKDFAAFSGFELVSWCLMSNHFHLLVRVPVQDVEAITDEEMVERLRHILSAKRLKNLVNRLNASPTIDMRRDVLDSFRKRIGHLPSYVKAIKQEFTQWFNAMNGREGTLWERRYHSTLIEDTCVGNPEESGMGEIARIVARYIDMNPVRANVEADPKDSDWSSYGAALRGDPVALRGLRMLWGSPDKDSTGKDSAPKNQPMPPSGNPHLIVHRMWLLRGKTEEDETLTKDEPSDDDAPKPRGRPISLTSLSRIRLLGSKAFRSRFGPAQIFDPS